MHAANDRRARPHVARNLLGGPLRAVGAVTGCGCGNTCMPGAILESGRGAVMTPELHETPRRPSPPPCPPSNCRRLVFHYYVDRRGAAPRPPKRRQVSSPLLRLTFARPIKATFLVMSITQKIRPLFCSVCSIRCRAAAAAAIGQLWE